MLVTHGANIAILFCRPATMFMPYKYMTKNKDTKVSHLLRAPRDNMLYFDHPNMSLLSGFSVISIPGRGALPDAPYS
jgi:hypothetical protein